MVMRKQPTVHHHCAVCGKAFPAQKLLPGTAVREELANQILRDHESWTPESFICIADLNRFRSRYVHSLLESEKGDLSQLEREVLDSLKNQELIARNVEEELEEEWTFGERMADRIASFGGSWTFLLLFSLFVVGWIAMNSLVLFWKPADPYPFILLNLLLSCLAAVQAPVIMMSQNRQEAKDRLRSQHDYQVNLKAELEIRHLHEKLDHLLLHQWQRLAHIQEIQLEQLAEISNRRL